MRRARNGTKNSFIYWSATSYTQGDCSSNGGLLRQGLGAHDDRRVIDNAKVELFLQTRRGMKKKRMFGGGVGGGGGMVKAKTKAVWKKKLKEVTRTLDTIWKTTVHRSPQLPQNVGLSKNTGGTARHAATPWTPGGTGVSLAQRWSQYATAVESLPSWLRLAACCDVNVGHNRLFKGHYRKCRSTRDQTITHRFAKCEVRRNPRPQSYYVFNLYTYMGCRAMFLAQHKIRTWVRSCKLFKIQKKISAWNYLPPKNLNMSWNLLKKKRGHGTRHLEARAERQLSQNRCTCRTDHLQVLNK